MLRSSSGITMKSAANGRTGSSTKHSEFALERLLCSARPERYFDFAQGLGGLTCETVDSK
jgi:hypothetical protein